MTDQNNAKLIDGIQKAEKPDIQKSRELVLSSIGEKFSASMLKKKEKLPKPDNSRTNVDGVVKANKQSEDSPLDAMPEDSNRDKNKEEKPEAKTEEPIKELATPTKKKRTYKKRELTKNKKKPEPIKHEKLKKEDYKVTIKKHWPKMKDKSKKSFAFLLLFASIILFIYLITSILVLNRGDQNKLLSLIGTKIFIPAVITKDGVISYGDYLSLKEGVKDKIELNQKIATELIMRRLYNKHATRDIDTLKERLPHDTEVNLVSYNRIKKIKEIINEEKNFTKVATKYGDVGQATISKENMHNYDFGPAVIDIEMNETSDIIITSKGYYIVHCFERVGEMHSVSYVFAPAINLEQYLAESITNYQFWKIAK